MLPTITQSFNNKMTRVDMTNTTLWFSYENLIAFEVRYFTGFVKAVRQNEWGGPTTGKHINSLNFAPEEHVDSSTFEALYRTHVERD